MLTSSVSNLTDGSRFNIEYFDDDTIDTIRLRIAASANVHPDRLFILIKLKFPHDYYQKDPRRWNALFNRLSYDGTPLHPEPFREYQLKYRSPQTNVMAENYSESEWMLKPESLQDLHSPTREFSEYRLFGTDDDRSYILPLDFSNGELVTSIPSARLPDIMTNTLLKTLYDTKNIEEFAFIPYSEDKAKNVRYVYYPRMTDRTEYTLSEESQNLLIKNTALLKGLLELDLKKEQPKKVSITRARIYAEFVDTDFGDAVRTRFEQIFYGVTLSKGSPYVAFFTSKNEVTRHKFHREEGKDEPSLNMTMWNNWRKSLPSRNTPTLLFYRGTSKENFDRIAITESDITITFYRDDNTENDSIQTLKQEGLKWLRSLDAVMAFLVKDDIDSERWSTHELDFIAKYSIPLDDIDLRRFNCVTFIFNQASTDEAKFSLLRTDREIYNITPEEVKLISMEIENRLTVTEVMSELNVSEQDARRLVSAIRSRLEEEPNLLRRKFRGFPLIKMDQKIIKVTNVNEIEHPLMYATLLRFILGKPDDIDLDKVCPKRMEKVTAQTAIAPVQDFEETEFDDEFGDIFGELPEEQGEPEEVKKEVAPPQKTIATKSRTTEYGYFLNRLGMFDPETFQSTKFNYAKSCNKEFQPIVLTPKDMKRLEGKEYDPQTYLDENKMASYTSTKGEDGLVICPEYWCVEDEIPLRKDQLVKEDGELTCPLCGKKLRRSDKDDLREYSVIKRTSGINYPGPVSSKKAKLDKFIPCCFKTPKQEKKEKGDGAYYVVGELSFLNEFRLSFLSQELRTSLEIPETYRMFTKPARIQAGYSGYFRVGLGRPSQTLPTFLGLKTKVVPPRDSVETVLKCSFLRTWKKEGDQNLSLIETRLKNIPPYNTNDYVREHLSKLISGIDTAFEKDELSPIEELEYASLFLQCDIFRIYIPQNTLTCTFYSPIVRPRTRGIVVLQNGKYLDILAHVSRPSSRGFAYKANVFEAPFSKETFLTLEKARNKACATEIPTLSKALDIISQILSASGKDNFEIILDPFGRAQAFFISGTMILPFLPSIVPNMEQAKRIGYSSISKETLPPHDKVLEYLKIAKEISSGYEFAEDMFNNKEERVEILLKSGLRIPVYPEVIERKEPLEVTETVNELGEDKLVFDGKSKELETNYREINYASEVYEFLLYELTRDIQEKYPELRESLEAIVPSRKSVEPLLRDWFEKTVDFVEVSTPINFISKVREPCGQFKNKESCTGNLCGWNGKTCNVQVRNSIKKEPLFHRLISSLLDNVKIRGMVLDGRTSPFFSTILYIQLPTELIYTDNEIRQLLAE